MARFPDSFITELTERNDIVDVVGSYVDLSKRSGSNRFGLCPFHSEKTPSFSVSPSKQIYHCFGCGKGGGVINFIMEVENISFPEAVEFLANRAGMKMPETGEDGAVSRRRARMLDLNRDAARFFHEALKSPSGQKAREYVARRELSPATVTSFGLGFAPDSWDALCKAMKEKGYTDYELLDADLVRRSSRGSLYDTFRNRLMFPVIDVRGNVIGFSGRILGDGEPKYLNSKETAVFSKGSNLFGLNLAKKSKAGNIILVEGNVDVVSLHQAGFDSAVASLGTSLTDEQARLISRYTSEVILAYDSDSAGLKASGKAISVFEKLDVKVKVLRWKDAKDPDEFIKLKGAGAFRNLIEKAENQLDYRIETLRGKYDRSSPDGAADYLKAAIALIAAVPDPVRRNVYAGRIAEECGTSAEFVRKEIESARKRRLSKEQHSVPKPSAGSLNDGISVRYDDIESAVAEEGVIRIVYLEPSLAPEARRLISPELFTSPELRHVYSVLLDKLESGQQLSSPNALSEELSSVEMSLFISVIDKPELRSSAADTLNDYIKRILSRSGNRSGTPDFAALADELKSKGKGYI